MTRYYVRNSLV